MAVAVTTISEALDISEAGVDVTSALGFPATPPYTVRVGSEWMRVTAGAGTTTWTVTRGYGGTTAAVHLINSAIYHVPDTYADLSRIKRRLRGGADTESTVDDDILSDFIGIVQSHLVSRLGMFLGPTAETSLLIDGFAATDAKRMLYIPFGFQSLTSLEVQSSTGAAWETVTAADLYFGPRTGEPRVDPNQPYTWLGFKDVVTGNWSYFPGGIENIRLTGVLGWPAPPEKLGEIADTIVVKMYQARQTGQRDYVGNDDEGNPIVSRYLAAEDHRVITTFWGEISGFESI